MQILKEYDLEALKAEGGWDLYKLAKAVERDMRNYLLGGGV